MPSMLDLIGATEGLLARAESNLTTLKSMNEGEEQAVAKIAPLLQKYTEVRRAIQKRKEALLAILVRLALAIGETSYLMSSGRCFTYVILSPEQIDVIGGDSPRPSWPTDYRGEYTLSSFVAKDGISYTQFCQQILTAVENFLTTSPGWHMREVQGLRDLTKQLRDLAGEE